MALQTSAGWAAFHRVLDWMAKPLQYSIIRVNTLRISPQEALKKTQQLTDILASSHGRRSPIVCMHPLLKDVITISAWPDAEPLMEPLSDKTDLPVIVIDATCANAVLKGAPIFKEGVLAISDNASAKSTVRIDVFREGCQRWIGYGVIHNLSALWKKESDHNESDIMSRCVAELVKGICILPPLPRELIENGLVVCQSLPSILTSHVLNPQPGERILDFGCGTGQMTTHIATLSSNKAEVIAVDNSLPRLNTLIRRCKLLGAKVTPVLSDVETFAKKQTVKFDCILVHPDHSNFGVRPCVRDLVYRGRVINNRIREYVEIAVDLLKPGGRLVYCTGSVVPSENDGVVRWLLDKNPNLKLEPAEPRIAPVGLKADLPAPSWIKLTPAEEKLIQRFNSNTPELESDPVNADVPGFFIACLKKVR